MSVHKSIVLFCKKISVSLFKLRNPLVSIVNGQEVFIYKSKVLLKSRGGNKIRIGNGVYLYGIPRFYSLVPIIKLL